MVNSVPHGRIERLAKGQWITTTCRSSRLSHGMKKAAAVSRGGLDDALASGRPPLGTHLRLGVFGDGLEIRPVTPAHMIASRKQGALEGDDGGLGYGSHARLVEADTEKEGLQEKTPGMGCRNESSFERPW